MGGAGDLLVSARFGNNILRYAAGSGAFVGQFNIGGGLSNPSGLAFDQSGILYAGNFNLDQVVRFAYDGTFLGVFLSSSSAPGFGKPLALVFGPDGDLYTTSNVTAGVYRYVFATGTFAKFNTGGTLSGATGLVFMPGGDLLVSSAGTNQILRYNGSTGAFIGTFGSGVTLSNPTDLQIGSDGALYAASTLSNQIMRYDFSTGVGSVFIGTGLSRPIGLAFDGSGNLYVANQGANNILWFNSAGAALGIFVPAGSGGLNGPDYFAFVPPPICATCPGDISGDLVRSGLDIQAFVACLINNPGTTACACADLNNDGVLDANDVDAFAQLLMDGPSSCS
jgi:sugar lactone lactonase YvrE